MDDIGCGVTSFDELIPSLRKIFECIRKSGLKLSSEKCEIATDSMRFLGNVITPNGISPQSEKIEKFLGKLTMPQTTKQVKRLIGFLQFFRNYIPNLGEKLLPFYKMLKKDVEIVADDSHYKSLSILKNDLVEAAKTTLRLPKPGKRYVLLCDASYYASGFVLMIEDYVEDESNKVKKKYAPVCFGSQLFTTAQLKFSVYYKEFLALYYALDNFAHYLWCSSHPVLVMTDNKSLTQFFQSKTIPPSLWNFLDRVLSFNLVIAHIPGKANYAADFVSRIQTDRSACISLKLSDKIPLKEIEIDTTAKTPDVSLTSIESFEDLFKSEPVSEELINQL